MSDCQTPELPEQGADFESWPLHDAVVTRFDSDFGSSSCRLEIEAFLKWGRSGVPTEDAVPCQIEWKGLRRVTLDFDAPWGRSSTVTINRHWQAGDHLFVIELQSGGTLRIEAVTVAMQAAR